LLLYSQFVAYLLLVSAGTCFFFFFFQAEDGIRDFHVTGVQTVLFRSRWTARRRRVAWRRRTVRPDTKPRFCRVPSGTSDCGSPRSEERRVGKECRSRW